MLSGKTIVGYGASCRYDEDDERCEKICVRTMSKKGSEVVKS